MKNFRHLPIIGAISLLVAWIAFAQQPTETSKTGPIRVLFLGHDSEHHNSNVYYPMIAKALGREAIYFDYVTTPATALGDADVARRGAGGARGFRRFRACPGIQ